MRAATADLVALSRNARAPSAFSRAATQGLSSDDQLLFEHYGCGPDATVPYGCIHHAFEAQAAIHPLAIAAIHQGDQITYRALDRHANRLAARLVEHGVAPGDHVAIFLHRSIPMLVGMLAAMKAGAAYVPQHVGVAPDAQLRHVIEAARTRVILTLSSLRHLVPVPDGHVCLEIDTLMADAAPESDPACAIAPRVDVAPGRGCFVLFTSGTTGVANGVTITHRNVCNILLTEPGNLGMRPGLRVSQILSIAFDMSAWEILGCLANGATLIIRGASIDDAVRQADIVIATPSVLGQIDADRCPSVKVVAVAGEPCPRPLADRWAAFATFYNSCGPTETTIVNTMQRYTTRSARLTIGSPTPNNTVYILDDELRPCPIGEVGEMWAGGDCVSAGYLGNDILNAERYRPDPFLAGGRMMFRTRDLGRWTPDGELEHLGRTDDQVKIRGFRVELDSVSRVLESSPGCAQAVTLKLDHRTLVAFVCPRTVDVAAATAVVATRLPYYCVPALVHPMDELPITGRGKIDKRALLALAQDQLGVPAGAA